MSTSVLIALQVNLANHLTAQHGNLVKSVGVHRSLPFVSALGVADMVNMGEDEIPDREFLTLRPRLYDTADGTVAQPTGKIEGL